MRLRTLTARLFYPERNPTLAIAKNNLYLRLGDGDRPSDLASTLGGFAFLFPV